MCHALDDCNEELELARLIIELKNQVKYTQELLINYYADTILFNLGSHVDSLENISEELTYIENSIEMDNIDPATTSDYVWID